MSRFTPENYFIPIEFSDAALSIAHEHAAINRTEAVQALQIREGLRLVFEDEGSEHVVLDGDITSLFKGAGAYALNDLAITRVAADSYKIKDMRDADASVTLIDLWFPASDKAQVPVMEVDPVHRYVPKIDMREFRPIVQEYVDKEVADYSVVRQGRLANMTKVVRRPETPAFSFRLGLLEGLTRQFGVDNAYDTPVINVVFTEKAHPAADVLDARCDQHPALAGMSLLPYTCIASLLDDLHILTQNTARTLEQHTVTVNHIMMPDDQKHYYATIEE